MNLEAHSTSYIAVVTIVVTVRRVLIPTFV